MVGLLLVLAPWILLELTLPPLQLYSQPYLLIHWWLSDYQGPKRLASTQMLPSPLNFDTSQPIENEFASFLKFKIASKMVWHKKMYIIVQYQRLYIEFDYLQFDTWLCVCCNKQSDARIASSEVSICWDQPNADQSSLSLITAKSV